MLELPPPRPPNSVNLYNFFSDIEIQDLKESKNTIYTMYIQPKNSLMFKLLAFWKKETPFLGQKCKKIGQGPPPNMGTAPYNLADMATVATMHCTLCTLTLTILFDCLGLSGFQKYSTYMISWEL